MSDETQYEIDELQRKVTELTQASNYAEAIEMLLRIHNSNNKRGKKYQGQTITVLNMLASLHKDSGEYHKAEFFHLQALDILQVVSGSTNALHKHIKIVSWLIKTHYDLSELYIDMGRYDKAEIHYEQNMRITSQVYGERSPEFSFVLHRLANLYSTGGQYDKAEPLIIRSLEILRQIFGENHPGIASGLSSLGTLYDEIGNYDKAEQLYLQALEMWRNLNLQKELGFAINLEKLASLYENMGCPERAESYYHSSLYTVRQIFGENHPNIAHILTSLASFYKSRGRIRRAESLYYQALEMWRKLNIENTPNFARCLDGLGILYHDSGDYNKAESFYLQSLNIDRQIFGVDSPKSIPLLQNLAILYVALGRIYDALAFEKKIIDIEDKNILTIFSMASEKDRMSFFQGVRQTYYIFLSFVLLYFNDSTESVRCVIDLIMKRKALGVGFLYNQRDVILSNYPNLRSKLQELNELNTVALSQERIERKERLEKDLAKDIPKVVLEQELFTANTETIINSLPEDSGLIEYVRFCSFDFHALPNKKKSRWKQFHYAALVLSSGLPDDIHIIDLGDANAIDKTINKFRMSITGGSENRSIQSLQNVEKKISKLMEVTGARNLVPIFSDDDQSTNMNYGSELRSLLFDKLSFLLEDRWRVFISPDGDISKLPFEVLPLQNEEGYFIDRYTISYLSTARDILRFGIKNKRLPSKPLIAADPDYDLGMQSLDNENKLPFRRLKRTEEEGEEIASLLGVEPILNQSVLEHRIKICHSPHILHIATHGFFFPSQVQQISESDHKASFSGAQFDGINKSISPLQNSDNPMLRCGLALAGANTRLLNGALPADAEDGILTAQDVSTMDLSCTELAVLSACDTGLGTILTGEGVFGLRRAFVIAGAQTLVMSLWKVDDEQTKELMIDFYRQVLAGKPRAEALREAQRNMKNNSKYSHVYYWGAFICQGNPGPLSELSKIIPFKKVGRAHVIYGELDPKLESVLSKISETIWKPDNK